MSPSSDERVWTKPVPSFSNDAVHKPSNPKYVKIQAFLNSGPVNLSTVTDGSKNRTYCLLDVGKKSVISITTCVFGNTVMGTTYIN